MLFPSVADCCPRLLLMAAVGFLDAFKFVLISPMFDRVLNPSSGSKDIQLFIIPRHASSGLSATVRSFPFSRMRGPWSRYALVGSTILKGIFDYTGTYLVNHAGFGMITDLRNDLYNSVSAPLGRFFLQRHTTGTLLSTIINDIERVQYAMSSVLAEFLQQFFTFFIASRRGCDTWPETWPGCCCCSFRYCLSAGKIGRRVRTPPGVGKTVGRVQNILHETITGNRIVKAFDSESWEISAISRSRAPACFAPTCVPLPRLRSVLR